MMVGLLLHRSRVKKKTSKRLGIENFEVWAVSCLVILFLSQEAPHNSPRWDGYPQKKTKKERIIS